MAAPDPERVLLRTPDGQMPAWLWTPATGSGPGVVVFHEIFGVGAYVKRRAADLAGLGYVVLAPEFYWRLGVSALPEEGADILPPAISTAQQVDWEKATADGVLAVEHLRGRIEVTGPVALVGFCFGGGLAFSVAAADDPDALVSYYGSALPNLHHLADQVSAPSLHHFGLSDAYLPPETVDEIRRSLTAQPGVTFETYEGAGHAFDNPNPMFHHPQASAEAWVKTVRFLAEHLDQPKS